MKDNFKEKETRQYVNSVRKHIYATFGEIKDVWKPLIKMLGDEHDLYLSAKNDVKKNGLRLEGARGWTQNPSIKIMNDALIQQQKLANSLGITPNSSIKLKLQEPGQPEDESDYLDSLIK